MREIEFRGYDGAEWVYGTAVNYDKYTNTWYLLEHGGPDDDWIKVSRVGQYTGLKDKHGTKIFEGDIVQIKGHPTNDYIPIDGNHEVYYNEHMVLCVSGWQLFLQLPLVTVVGNKFENPELLNNYKGEV